MEALSAAIGVSRPTLSKFFQDPDSVRDSTRRRIRDGLASVEYVPNFFATKMNRKETRLIGVIVPHLKDLFFSSLIERIETTATEAGYGTIIQNSHGSPEHEARAATTLMSMSVDGIIIAPIGRNSRRDHIARMVEQLPTVFVDSHFPGEFQSVDFVGTDNQQSMSLIVDYLARSGDAPVLLGMPPLNSNSEEREAAYRTRMEALGRRPETVPYLDVPVSWEFEKFAYDLMNLHFSRGAYTSGTLLCANDRLAIGALRAAHRHRLLPEGGGEARLRIAGHDDHPLSAYVHPGLTTVSQDIEAIGKAAMGQLLRRMQGDAPGEQGGVSTRFAAELKLRGSA